MGQLLEVPVPLDIGRAAHYIRLHLRAGCGRGPRCSSSGRCGCELVLGPFRCCSASPTAPLDPLLSFELVTGISDDTVIVFVSDNGAPPDTGVEGRNYPYKGFKASVCSFLVTIDVSFESSIIACLYVQVWEGGSRVPGFIYAPGRLSPASIGERAFLQALAQLVALHLLAFCNSKSTLLRVKTMSFLSSVLQTRSFTLLTGSRHW